MIYFTDDLIDDIDMGYQPRPPRPPKPPKLKDKMKDYGVEIGWIVGIIAFILIGWWSVSYAYQRWDHNIARAKVHHPGWMIHEGSVVDNQSPNFTDQPPDRDSTIQFTDFNGNPQQAAITLPYRSKVGDNLQVDVAASGSIYVPDDVNRDYNAPDNPQKAHVVFWPSAGIFLFSTVANLVVSIILGLIAAMITENLPETSVRGRLGSR